jgi:hypothetical protein
MNGMPHSEHRHESRPTRGADFPAPAQRPSGISLEFLGFLAGIGTAPRRYVVIALAKRLSAFVLAFAMLASASGTVFALNRHPVCEARQHDCGQPAKISTCCCDDLGTPREAGTPAQSRTELAAGMSAAPLPPQLEHPLLTSAADIAIQSSPPRLALLDLTTLFACLLI